MRLVLEIAKTPNGRYEGCLMILRTAGRQDLAGALELLAILEQQLPPDEFQNAESAERGSGIDRDPGANVDVPHDDR